MADQGKWFKLWESALDDQDLENLSVHQWYCWARFGTYLKKHGKDGKIRLRSPATALTNLLRLTAFRDVISVIKQFPNYVVEEGESVTANVTSEPVTFNVTCQNWSKYQGDFSGDRVRRYRRRVTANVTVQEEKRRDVEEKRGDVSPKPPTSSPSATSTAPANGKAQGRAEHPPKRSGPMALRPGEDPWAVPAEEMITPEDMAALKAAVAPKPVPAPEPIPEPATAGGNDDVF